MAPSRRPTLATLLAILAVLHAAVFAFAPLPAAWIEAGHARGVFPLLRAAIGTPLSLLPFAAGEVLLGLAALLCLATLGQWILVRAGKVRRTWLGRWFLISGALAVHLYLLGFGWLYRRPPLAERLDLPAVSDPRQAVIEAALASARAARAARCQPPEGFDLATAGRQTREALEAVLPELGAAPLPALRLKSVWPAGVLMRFGVSGIFSPFTFEPNVDPALDPLDLAFVAAHEWAHAAGFGGEDEANFVAWLACTRSQHPWLRYAGHVRAYRTLQASARGHPEIVAAAGPEVHADIERAKRAWRKHESPALATIQSITYDKVLRAQGVKSGIRSYGEMVQLIVAWRARGGETR
jgi:hypothetical protein